MKEATENTIHPVRNGTTVELGDYGYFKDGQWFRLGNIMRIKGLRFSPNVLVHEENHKEVVLVYGVSFKAEADATASAYGVSANSVLEFKNDNSFFVRCLVDKIIEFDSIDVEILTQIKRLDAAGKWQPDYCVVVSVLYSPRYVAVFSSHKDREARLSASIDKNVPFENIDASVGIIAGGNNEAVELVKHSGDMLLPVGFRTVVWKRDLFGMGRRMVRYVGDDDTPESHTDSASDFDSEPTIFNVDN